MAGNQAFGPAAGHTGAFKKVLRMQVQAPISHLNRGNPPRAPGTWLVLGQRASQPNSCILNGLHGKTATSQLSSALASRSPGAECRAWDSL